MTKDKTPSYSVNYATIVMVLLSIVGKLAGLIDWPWFLILLPVWWFCGVCLIICIMIYFLW